MTPSLIWYMPEVTLDTCKCSDSGYCDVLLFDVTTETQGRESQGETGVYQNSI